MKEEKKTTKKPVAKKTVQNNKPNKKTETVEMVKKSVEFSLVEVIFIVLITGIAVSIASGLIIYNNYDSFKYGIGTSKDDFTDFYDNYERIINNYVEEVDKKELIDAAIKGMYDYLGDDYSVYMSEDDTSDLEEQLQGEYTGVGIEIYTQLDKNNKGQVVVRRVFDNSPAQRAGIKSGDILTKIDDVEIDNADEFSSTIKRGEKDTYKITYIRDGKENSLTLTREKVFINSVSSETHGTVGYIKVETFSATTKSQIEKYLKGFDKNVKSIVIDLRDNTGGYLDTAYSVADLFVEKGKNIYQMKEREGKVTTYKALNGVYRKFDKIVVIINESSASASEILALALKESAGATLVGTKSFGKGTVQDTKVYQNGSMAKYTTAYWLSPNGNSINKEGIKPDIEVKDVEKQKDEAIKAAK